MGADGDHGQRRIGLEALIERGSSPARCRVLLARLKAFQAARKLLAEAVEIAERAVGIQIMRIVLILQSAVDLNGRAVEVDQFPDRPGQRGKSPGIGLAGAEPLGACLVGANLRLCRRPEALDQINTAGARGGASRKPVGIRNSNAIVHDDTPRERKAGARVALAADGLPVRSGGDRSRFLPMANRLVRIERPMLHNAKSRPRCLCAGGSQSQFVSMPDRSPISATPSRN